jgi:glutathione S-transferase
MKLHYFPLSSYSQKVLMALYEKELSFTPQLAELFTPEGRAALEKLNPVSKIPVLELDDGQLLAESSIIIEYLDGASDKGPRLIPTERMAALRVRYLDRVADQYVNNQFMKVFFDARRPQAERDSTGVAEARKMIERAYGLLDETLAKSTWLAGDAFSLADCAAAPALSYSRMVAPFDTHKNLSAYVERLHARPSFQRIQAEAAPLLAKTNG